MSVSTPKQVIFRTDASAEIGGGHVMRCMALAYALARRGMAVGFAVGATTLPTVPALGTAGFQIMPIDPGMELAKALGAYDIAPGATLVVDHYGIDAQQVSDCRMLFDNIVLIDDMAAGPLDCDLLINQGARMPGDLYVGKLPQHARVLAGPHFALLRPDFAKLRDGSVARRKSGRVERLFVSFGLTDVGGWALSSVKALASEGLRIDVAIGSRAGTVAALQALASRHDNVRLHIDAGNVAELMAEADLAIGAGGSTSWERCTLGLPVILAVVAENQRSIAQDLAGLGAARLLETQDGPTLRSLLDDLRNDPAGMQQMQESAAAICDGQGADRVAEAINAMECPEFSGTVTLRPSTPQDRADFWLIRNNAAVRAVSGNGEVIPWGIHVAWWERALDMPGREMFSAELDGRVVGYLRFDQDVSGDFATSIALAPHYHGRGLGGLVLEAGLAEMARRHPGISIIAWVRNDNVASARMFERLGYVETGAEQDFRVLRFLHA